MDRKAKSKRTARAEDKLRAAVTLHQQGRLAEAEVLYKGVLQRMPRSFDALHLLGVVRFQQRDFGRAADLIRRALQVNPESADAHSNLGGALRELKRYEDATDSFRHAIRLRPDHPTAHNNLGNLLMLLGNPREAVASYRRAIAIRPNHAEAHSNLGNASNALGNAEDAVASYRQALAIRPDFAEAHNNLGTVLRALKRADQAVASYRRALEIRTDYAEAHNNLGNALADLNRHDEALACFDRAVSIRPDYAEAYCNRGDALARLRQHDAAIGSYHQALARRPDYAEAHARLATAHADRRDYEAAVAGYRKALLHRPDYPFALGALAEAKTHICDWAESETLAQQVASGVSRGQLVCRPFSFLMLTDEPEEHLRCARTYAQARFGSEPHQPPDTGPVRDGRLRVAYLSADFHAHATAYLTADLFERHDRDRFEVFAISFGPDDGSQMRQRLEQGFEHFIDVTRMSDIDVARRMSELGIHIAVDLKGYTQGARPGILSHRPAPIQVSYLGFPGSMGANFVDYILVDRFTVPADQQPLFTEKLVHLPDSYQVNDGKRAIADRSPSRADCGLPEGGFVFCCFNNARKITPPVFDIWMRLLGAVPGSALWLIDDTEAARCNLRREATVRDIDPERLVFAPRCRLPDHLARHRAADLFLDTLPYNAHTTASDALWAGLPVLTCAGRAFAGRVAGSLLHAVGLPEMVTRSLSDYEALARDLAGHPDRLAGIRNRLRDSLTTTSLFDADRFRRNIEAAYTRMWRIWSDGGPVRPFAVP